jgi:hypothetical protein
MPEIDSKPAAWQPFTFRGVADFARVRLSRLWLVQLLVGLIVGVAVAWSAHLTWYPVIGSSVAALPDDGVIRAGQLEWPVESPMLLAENRFLSVAVDLEHGGQARYPAHLHVEFGGTDVRVFSLLGYWQLNYWRGWILPFNRPEVEPWWGAWSPAILGLLILATIAALFASWMLLASFYAPAVWLFGFFADRELGWRSSWQLAGAALMPGALFMALAIVVYGLAIIELPGLAAAFGLHLVIGWVFLLGAPLRVPAHVAAPAQQINPFVANS